MPERRLLRLAAIWVLWLLILRLKSNVRGFFRRVSDPAAFFVNLPQGKTSTERPPAADPALERTLRARNERNAVAVQTHDAEPQIAVDAEDAAVRLGVAPATSERIPGAAGQAIGAGWRRSEAAFERIRSINARKAGAICRC